MPTGLIRITAVAHCVLILLSMSTLAAAHESSHWTLTMIAGPVAVLLLWGGHQGAEKVGRRATLRITRRGLIADQAVSAGYGLMALSALLLGGLVEQLPWESARTLWVVVVVYLVGCAAILVYRRPQLILTPEGVIVRRVRRTVRGGWDAVPWMSIPFGELQPRQDFVEFAVGHYIANPAERAGMVSAVGLSRLKLAFAQHLDRLRRDREDNGVVARYAVQDGGTRT